MTSVLDSVRSLHAAADAALPCARDVSALSGGEAVSLMSELSTLARKLDAARALVAAELERQSARELGAAGLAQATGLRNGAELVQRLSGSSIAEAKKLLRTGVLLQAAEAVAPAGAFESEPAPRDLAVLRALPGDWQAPIAVAVRNEWLSAAQSDALIAGLGAPRAEVLTPRWREAALELVSDCWAGDWPAEELGRAAKRMRASLDRLAAQADAKTRYAARSLKRWQLANGNWKWDLELDPETDAALWTPLSTRLSARLGGPRFRTDDEIARARELEGDPRSNEQLLADEFAGIYRAGVGTATTAGAFGEAVPHVSIVVTTGELHRSTAVQAVLSLHEQGDHSRCGTSAHVDGAFGEAVACAGPDVGTAWVEGGPEPISALSALSALCDGAFTPLLFDETGKAIDVGKENRVFSKRQRRAMAVRDGSCMWPGCSRPPGECEAHHRNPWSESPSHHRSETKDGVLLCRFHHLSLHNHGARISREGSVFWLHWPGRQAVRLVPKSGARTELRLKGTVA